ncbi:kinase-like domain-containing protein [Thelephora terrestris]|uniref:Kinase-like domain-containing protein n=1 Tax=Thelephora terrestris TaxID=56493 RepID=A0A9P6LAF5_9AGAM|nr:kinase-like domain-containing protein [Thelephora terrestris]
MSSQAQLLQHLCTLDKSSPEFSRSLYAFIRLDEKGEYSRSLQRSDSARLVDFLDGALDAIPVTDPLFRRCLRRLRLICAHHNVLPSSHIVREGLRKTSDNPVAFGGFADVWEGKYEGRKVCVKALRVHNPNTSTDNALAPFYGEAVVWKRLSHPNVVQFLGVTTTPLQIVLEWMPNGTLTAHTINSSPQVDRLSLLLDVAEGVNYLHTCHVLHGDLKGPNILIDGHGHARVSDFGLAPIVQGVHRESSFSPCDLYGGFLQNHDRRTTPSSV